MLQLKRIGLECECTAVSAIGEPLFLGEGLAIGAGAILQVIVEVTAYLVRTSERTGTPWLSPAVLGGFAAGIAAMHVTGMLVKI